MKHFSVASVRLYTPLQSPNGMKKTCARSTRRDIFGITQQAQPKQHRTPKPAAPNSPATPALGMAVESP